MSDDKDKVKVDLGNEYTYTINVSDMYEDQAWSLDGQSFSGAIAFNSNYKKIRVFKCRPNAELPVYGTDNAACFDLQACYKKYDEITYYTQSNVKAKIVVRDSPLTLYPRQRMLVPTGLVFDLDKNQSLRIHPRSGLALKNGVIVANCEGIVDSDYTHETFVMLQNVSDVPFEIEPGMRIAQGEIVNVTQYEFEEVSEQPTQKTDRSGGFGSTGTN